MNPSYKFKTISQVSKEFNIPQHVLRFWEGKFSQLSPLKLSGNRRYYRKIDIELISYIKNLLYTDCISIKGVQKIFGNQKINKILKNKNPIFQKENQSSTSSNVNLKTSNTLANTDKTILKEIIKGLKEIKSLLNKS